MKHNSSKPSNITRARSGAWYLLTAFQTHKDTKALSQPSNSDVNNCKYANKQACKDANTQAHKQKNSTAQRRTVILRMNEMNTYVIYIVIWDKSKYNTIAASPQTSREPDRGHGTYKLHSKHTKTPRRYSNRPTAMSTIANTPTSKHANLQARKQHSTTANGHMEDAWNEMLCNIL
jgi:hypothetical protein